jgi:hypothetical protein
MRSIWTTTSDPRVFDAHPTLVGHVEEKREFEGVGNRRTGGGTFRHLHIMAFFWALPLQLEQAFSNLYMCSRPRLSRWLVSFVPLWGDIKMNSTRLQAQEAESRLLLG